MLKKDFGFCIFICIIIFFSENLSVDTTNLGTSQTLHADETGTITLSHYSGDQTLTAVHNFNSFKRYV